jgi:hypothetical protein
MSIPHACILASEHHPQQKLEVLTAVRVVAGTTECDSGVVRVPKSKQYSKKERDMLKGHRANPIEAPMAIAGVTQATE